MRGAACTVYILYNYTMYVIQCIHPVYIGVELGYAYCARCDFWVILRDPSAKEKMLKVTWFLSWEGKSGLLSSVKRNYVTTISVTWFSNVPSFYNRELGYSRLSKMFVNLPQLMKNLRTEFQISVLRTLTACACTLATARQSKEPSISSIGKSDTFKTRIVAS